MGFEFVLPCSWKRQLKTVTKVKFIDMNSWYGDFHLSFSSFDLVFKLCLFISNHLFRYAYHFFFQNKVFHTTRYQRLWYNDCTVVTAAMSACILAQKRYCPSFNRLWGHICNNHPRARQTWIFVLKMWLWFMPTQSNLVLSLKMYDWQVNEKELVNERCKSEKLPPIVNARLQFDACIFWQFNY